MSGHTPGPWRVYPAGSSVPHYQVCDRIVSDVPSGRCLYDGLSDADARLIAAAPRMYEYIASRAANGCATAKAILESINGDA